VSFALLTAALSAFVIKFNGAHHRALGRERGGGFRYAHEQEDHAIKYLTLAQAAARLGVSRQMIHRYVRDGRIHAERVGWQWLIAPRDCRKPKPRKPGPEPST